MRTLIPTTIPTAMRFTTHPYAPWLTLPLAPPSHTTMITLVAAATRTRTPQERERFLFRFGCALPRHRGSATDYSTGFVRALPRPNEQRAINCLGGSPPPEEKRRRTVCFVGLRARARRPHDKE